MIFFEFSGPLKSKFINGPIYDFLSLHANLLKKILHLVS